MIEIPMVEQPDGNADPVTFADYVLGQLVSNAPAFVESSTSSTDEEVVWKMSSAGNKTTIISTNLRRYRHILARIGHHYMDDQLYCGFTNRIFNHGEHCSICFIYMGNCGDTGFWFRAYSRPFNTK